MFRDTKFKYLLDYVFEWENSINEEQHTHGMKVRIKNEKNPLIQLNKKWSNIWMMFTFVQSRLSCKCSQSWNLCYMAKNWPTPEQATGQLSRWTWEIPAQDALAPCPEAMRCILRPLFPDGKFKTSVYLGLLFYQMEACNNY